LRQGIRGLKPLLDTAIGVGIAAGKVDNPCVWFKQDGATAHFTPAVRCIRDVSLRDHSIGRGRVPWPPR
jgi:hypothetical protein